MATDLSGSLERGFNLGLRFDAAKEEKRAREFQEGRQLKSDVRADEDLTLRRKRDVRDQQRLDDAERREASDRAYRYGKERQNELVTAATKAQESGGPIPSDVEAEYAQVGRNLARARQEAENWASRLSTGERSLDDTSPRELRKNFTVLTGRLPEEAPEVRQAVQDVQTGMETGNQGLLLQGVNGVMKPQLMRGLGQPSPYGGKIVRKEVIGLDPARDGAGRDHPDKFIPRLRVYVEKDGKTSYYDAPMTRAGSTDPNDGPVPVRIDRALDTLGNLGVLLSAMDHPEIKAKLEEGAKTDDGESKKYLDELYARSRPTKKVETTENINMPADSGETLRIKKDAQGHEIGREVIKHGKKEFRPLGGGGGASKMRAALAAVDDAVEAGEITTEEAAEEKRAIRSSIRPGSGSKKPPSSAEQTQLILDAERTAATKLGMQYDANSKDYRNLDGTSVTPAQRKAVAEARGAAAEVVRKAAAEGRRPNQDDIKAAIPKVTPQSKFEKGKPYTNSKGEKAVYGGVDAEGKNIWLKP